MLSAEFNRAVIRSIPTEQGMALPIALTVSALLLVSSLSMQSLALHARQRADQQRHAAGQRDRLASAAMEFLQVAQGPQSCLLAWPSDQWDAASVCPAADPQHLRQGRMTSLPWRLQRWEPDTGSRGRLSLLWADGSLTRQWLEVSP